MWHVWRALCDPQNDACWMVCPHLCSDQILKSEVLDPHNLELWLKVDGELKQKGRTHDMLFSVPKLISFCSSIMTLEEGDVILTGTPAGVGPVVAGQVGLHTCRTRLPMTVCCFQRRYCRRCWRLSSYTDYHRWYLRIDRNEVSRCRARCAVRLHVVVEGPLLLSSLFIAPVSCFCMCIHAVVEVDG